LPAVVRTIRANRRELARLLTRIENNQAAAELAALYPCTGHAHVIGITGAPGAGKSSLVNALARYYRRAGQTVGIIAVDPTSPFSGGAVMGDRIRMNDLSGDSGVFIRSMATRGYLGGLAHTTGDAVRALDAAGFDWIIVETVGAGQSEVDIARTAHTTVVMETPGLGDDIQAIKAGILEIADILVVNKADRPGAESTAQTLRVMLDLGHQAERAPHHRYTDDIPAVNERAQAWQTPIVQAVATDGRGIPELAAQITAHREYLNQSGTLTLRERGRIEAELLDRLRGALLAQLLDGAAASMLPVLVERVLRRDLDPASAAQAFLARVRQTE
jgi:LAO/AO transport system kinase